MGKLDSSLVIKSTFCVVLVFEADHSEYSSAGGFFQTQSEISLNVDLKNSNTLSWKKSIDNFFNAKILRYYNDPIGWSAMN